MQRLLKTKSFGGKKITSEVKRFQNIVWKAIWTRFDFDPFLQKGVGINPNSPHMVHRASAVGQFNGFTSHLHAWATQLLHSKASQAL